MGIRNHQIDLKAAIDPHKIQDNLFGETFYLTNPDLQEYQFLRDRVTPDRILFSLDEALNAVTASRGDVIKITPNYTETITGAGGITLDKTDAQILGFGRYDARPSFLMDGAGASMLVTSANMSFENCVFLSGHDNLAYLALVTAKGFRFAHNYVGENTSGEDWLTSISIGDSDNDADGVEIVDNEFIGLGATATGCLVINKNCNDVKLIGNKITGEFGVTPFAPILMPDGEIAFNMQIYHNHIHNLHDADSVVGISMLEAVSTGWMMYNHCYALDVTGETPFLVGSLGIYCSQNYTSYIASLSGFEYPAINTA